MRAHVVRAGSIADPAELTPIEWHDAIAYKRDDRFLPFSDVDVNGGKVRQTLALVGARLDEIKREHASTLLCASGVHSQYGLVVARVAQHYGLRCVLFLGASSPQTSRRHRIVRLAEQCGAQIDHGARVAYESALLRRVSEYQRERGGLLLRRFGAAPEDRAAVIDTNAAQCANVPEQIERVVVPVGSGVSSAGIIAGLAAHAPQARPVLVQIAGYDRRPVLDELGVDRSSYDWHAPARWPYSERVREIVAPGFVLDPIYESKAHVYMRALLDPHDGATLFWVVADTNPVR